MRYKQLEFFPESEEEKQNKEIEKIKKDLDKIRKGHYARGNELKKEVDELRHMYQTLVMALCKNTKNNNILILE